MTIIGSDRMVVKLQNMLQHRNRIIPVILLVEKLLNKKIHIHHVKLHDTV